MSKLNVGDRVRHTNGETPEDGVVVFVVADDSYLVEFEGWGGGHGVKRNQWYCNEEYLLPVDAAKTETVVSVSSTQITRDTLTIRDQFAMAALTGFMSAHASDGTWSPMGAIDDAAKFSYTAADAMLEERKVKA